MTLFQAQDCDTLYEAIYTGHLCCFKRLYKAGQKLDKDLVELACQQGHFHQLQWAKQKGADVDSLIPSSSFLKFHQYQDRQDVISRGCRDIYEAVDAGHLSCFLTWCALRQRVDKQMIKDACEKGHFHLVCWAMYNRKEFKESWIPSEYKDDFLAYHETSDLKGRHIKQIFGFVYGSEKKN